MVRHQRTSPILDHFSQLLDGRRVHKSCISIAASYSLTTCWMQMVHWRPSTPVCAIYPFIKSSRAAFILWCLIGQALQGRCPSAGEVGACIFNSLKQYHGAFLDIQEGGKAVLEPFEKLFRLSLNVEPSKEATIILDHVDAVDRKNLRLLKESVQKVLDKQREDDVTQVRCLITGKPTADVKWSFQGLPPLTKTPSTLVSRL